MPEIPVREGKHLCWVYLQDLEVEIKHLDLWSVLKKVNLPSIIHKSQACV